MTPHVTYCFEDQDVAEAARLMKEEQIRRLFLCSPPVHARAAREIEEAITRLPGPRKPPFRDRLPDLAVAVREAIEEALCSAPLAGPEAAFREELLRVAEDFPEVCRQTGDGDLEALARLYAGKELDPPSDVRPLPPDDRRQLSLFSARLAEIREH